MNAPDLLRRGAVGTLLAPVKLFKAMMMVPNAIILVIAAIGSLFPFLFITLIAACVMFAVVYYL